MHKERRDPHRPPPDGYAWLDISPKTRVLLPIKSDYLTYRSSNIQLVPEEHNETQHISREEDPLALPYSALLRRMVSRQCNTPMIMPPNNSIVVTFDSSRTYRCGSSGVAPPESRYMAIGYTQGSYDSGLNMYGFTWNGQHLIGFCLDHTKSIPAGTYSNISMETAMQGHSRQEQLAVTFAIAQSPPLVTDDEGARELFEMLGSPCADEMNGYDAFGLVQATVWCLLGQGDPGVISFQNCPEGTASDAKLQCLYDAMNVLYSMAFDYAAGNLDCGGVVGGLGSGSGSVAAANFGCRACTCCGTGCGSCGCGSSCNTCEGEEGEGCRPGRACCGCQIGKLFVCYTDTRVTDQSDTYLVFVGCVNDMREHCGRILLGPFKLDSSNNGTPDIVIVPCEGCPPVDITLTDYCGCRLEEPPEIGDEFYITFLPPCIRYCFDLKASMWTMASAVYYFRRPGVNNLQPIGVPFMEERYRETSIHICIDLSAPPPPPPPPPPSIDILLNNNNNNNNNNDLNNDDNNNNSNLLGSMLDNIMSGLLSRSQNMMLGGVLDVLMGGGLGGPGMCGMPGMRPGSGMGMLGMPFSFSPCGPCAPCKPFCAPPPAFPPPRPCRPCPPPPSCPPCPPCPPPFPPCPPWPSCPPKFPPCPPMPPTFPPPCNGPCVCSCQPDPCANTINLIVPPAEPPMPVFQCMPLPVPCTALPPMMLPPQMPRFSGMGLCPAMGFDPGMGSGMPPMPYQQPSIFGDANEMMPSAVSPPAVSPPPPAPWFESPEAWWTAPASEPAFAPYAAPVRKPGPSPIVDPGLLLPQVSGAPHPDLSTIEFDDDFYRDWYQM